MPEQPNLNSDPLTERLGRFTPDSGGLDRDALLYAAGRASAHPSRLWPALAGLLGITQVVTLTLLLSRPTSTGSPQPAAPAPERERDLMVPAPAASPEPSTAGLMTARLPVGGLDDLPSARPVEQLISHEWTLNVLAMPTGLRATGHRPLTID
jgi:hypothetical protein